MNFHLENPSHRVDGLWIVSLEAPTTEMVSLQVFVGQHRNLASKSSDADQCRAPRETIEKKVSKVGVDFGPKVACIWRGFLGAWKKGLKNSGRFRDKIRDKICDKIVPVFGKIRDRIRAAKSKIHSELPTHFCVLSPRTAKSRENALSMQGKGRTSKTFWEKKIVNELLRRRDRSTRESFKRAT